MIIKKSQAVAFDRPTGNVQAVIVDISEPFMMFNKISGENKLTSIWTYQLINTYTKDDGTVKRHLVSEYVTPSLHEKAKLRARLNGLAGRTIPDGEIPDSFDTTQLLGINCVLNLLSDENGYSRIQAISAIGQGTTKIVAESYTRPQWINDTIAENTKTKVDPGPASNAVFIRLLKTAQSTPVPGTERGAIDLNRPLTGKSVV